jgi:hypothetical protein
MNPKLMLTGALALIIPTTVPALAYAQGYGYGYPPPQAVAPQGYTELRVAPPPAGRVYVYDGHRLVGRFDSPGEMTVPTGRPYHVVVMRGDTQVWNGDVTAMGTPLDLDWGAGQRYRGPMQPPPAYGYGYGGPFGAPPPPSGYYPTPPRPYEGAPGYEEAAPPYASEGYAAPVIGSPELRSLLREMDQASDDQDRLSALADAALRYSFAVPQADWILGRFHSDAYRLAALERMRGRILDRNDAFILLQRFHATAAREQAQHMLGW